MADANDLTLLHNPRCSKSRAALAEVEVSGRTATVVRYLDDPLDAAQLTALLGILEDPPSALVRRDPAFAELGLTPDDVATAEQVAAVLAAHPALMERPVLVRGPLGPGGRAIIGRPAERVAPFLAG